MSREEAFNGYGALSSSAADPSPVGELLQTLAWTGAAAAPHRASIATLIDPVTGLSRSWHADVHRILQSLPDTPGVVKDDCCGMPAFVSRLAVWTSLTTARNVRDLQFEDHTGAAAGFDDVFVGKPSLVVFFYTRCDNPHKCSLTVTKLARVQRLLADRGVLEGVRTTAITYDPAFDTPERLRDYASQPWCHDRTRASLVAHCRRYADAVPPFRARRELHRIARESSSDRRARNRRRRASGAQL